jgi:hypothetical protein
VPLSRCSLSQYLQPRSTYWFRYQQNEKTIGELKQEWGKDYDNRMEDARKAFKDMGLEEDVAEEVGKLLGVGLLTRD